jgi:hypothetical protein
MNDQATQGTTPSGSPPSPAAQCSAYWHLFKHISDNHGLTLLDSELEDICQAADKMRMEKSGGVTWILINALHHLTLEQLDTLGEEIAKRAGAIYTPNDPAQRPGHRDAGQT